MSEQRTNESTCAAEAEALRRERRRAEGLATVAAIALHELERDGKIWPHTRDLLAASVAAYEAGKAEQPTYTIAADGSAITCLRCGLTSHHPEDVAHRYCDHCKLFHGLAQPPTTTPEDAERQAANAARIATQWRALTAGPGKETTEL